MLRESWKLFPKPFQCKNPEGNDDHCNAADQIVSRSNTLLQGA
jgi:hypothetical protein